MVGNRRSSLADVKKSHKSSALYENKGSHSRALSRGILPYERSPILRPRGTLNMRRPVNNSSFSGYRNNFECMNPDPIECNDSANLSMASSSSTTLPSKASGAKKLKNVDACLSCTSDESGSDLDIKACMVANFSKPQEMDSWSSIASSSSEGASSTLLGGAKCSLTGMKRDTASSSSYGKCMPTRRANAPSSSIRHGLSTSHTSRNCLDRGHSSYSAIHSGRTGWVNLEKIGDTSTDRVDLPARGSKLVNQPRQVSGNNVRPESKRKSSTQPRRSERVKPWSSNGVGYKDIDKAARDASMTAGSSHMSARPHALTFEMNVQSTDLNPSAAMAAEKGFLVENGAGAGSSRFLDEVGIDTNSYTEFGRRKSSSPCGFVGGLSSSSSTCRHPDKSLVNRRSSTNLPSSSNYNQISPHPAPDSLSDINLDSFSRPSGSRHPSFLGGERDMTRRSREKQPMSSSTARSIHERSFGFSGPPPSRPPPLPPSGSASTSAENIFVPPSSTTEPRPRSASRFTRPSIHDRDQGRPNSLTVGTSSHPSSSLSNSQYFQSHLAAAEGLSEVLSALERIEREEDLSYEQILMLEATVLLGGLGLSDQHRGMRLDVDNMSYEELLALEERIGDVKMGLSEETITRCVRRKVYMASAMSSTCAADDVAVKCSICQEEFEEGVEVALLDCAHCHHFSCIEEWLQQKNQCPICKAPASV